MNTKNKVRLLIERHLGLHIIPVHFYSPIPAIADVAADVSTKVKPCRGLAFRGEEQAALMAEFSIKYGAEYVPAKNIGLSKADAFMLYAFIRSARPKRMIEIGSGESTRISLAAISQNIGEGFPCLLTAIDPYPPPYLRNIADPNFELLAKRAQDVPEAFFRDADILFIDSSHVSKIGSDVNYEILTIIPELKAGALIHWHDIMLPQDYPRDWIERGMYWNESYLVHAFMLYNDSFRVLWAARYMQVHHADRLRSAFPYMEPSHRLSSFWIERVK